ncbi:hypothetical protein PV08_11650 [Exophiala spinifera]|uniref:Enoyl reductase (ER) domain-containing protein n=1 Tax=Exophiala spinifera TaxID=91928 RepID=A0A0D1Y717_9EURO|nr:uncharacterized protein PV08_11650 [Exophiala spinifera]KIW10686.1 hypothetical protein PV08_11650 [Exophiala spinifera]
MSPPQNSVLARAIVSYEPTEGQIDLRLEDVSIRDLKDDEVLIRVVATGICHTDLLFGAMQPPFTPYPKVLGHEGWYFPQLRFSQAELTGKGAGYIEQVGKNVQVGKPGDAVLLSFSYCSTCRDCSALHPSYCESFSTVNYVTDPETFLSPDGQNIGGLFFGQSSMASYTIARQASVVNVSSLIHDESELKIFAPLGCGFQTGFGAIDLVAKAGSGDAVVVMGIGGVGFSAIAGAKLNKCHTIIAIDRVEQRLQLAREFGATHVINSTETEDLVAEVKSLTKGAGSTITLDTTGNMRLIENGLAMTANRGQMIVVGVPPMDAQLIVHVVSFLQTGKILRGCIEGDATPGEYIPTMIKHFRAGQFPIDKLVKLYPVGDLHPLPLPC